MLTFDPCLEGYRQLKKQARQAGGWPGWRERVLEHLRALALRERLQRAGSRRPFRFEGDAASVLVEVLLWDKEVDSAWLAAQELGCSDDVWLDLARACEGPRPEQALVVYQRHVDRQLESTNDQGYRVAVEYLRRVRALMKKMERAQDFADYVLDLRTTHKRKRNFLLRLDGAKLV